MPYPSSMLLSALYVYASFSPETLNSFKESVCPSTCPDKERTKMTIKQNFIKKSNYAQRIYGRAGMQINNYMTNSADVDFICNVVCCLLVAMHFIINSKNTQMP